MRCVCMIALLAILIAPILSAEFAEKAVWYEMQQNASTCNEIMSL